MRMLARERVKAESYHINQLLLKTSGRNPKDIASKPITPLFYATQPHGSEGAIGSKANCCHQNWHKPSI
jgi:hypothetical protein